MEHCGHEAMCHSRTFSDNFCLSLTYYKGEEKETMEGEEKEKENDDRVERDLVTSFDQV